MTPSRLPQLLWSLVALTLLASSGCHHQSSTVADAGSTPDAGSDAGGDDAGIPDAGAADGGDAGPQGIPSSVNELVPDTGPVAGGTNLLITGSGFVEGFASTGGGAVSALTKVLVGGVAATSVNVIDDNRIQAQTPAGMAGPADVVIKNPNGTGTCSGCFRYLAHVEVDSITPASGPTSGGIAVTVHGAGFDSTAVITFAGAPLISPVLVDAQTITGSLPPGSAGPAEVAATTLDGRASSLGVFVYQAQFALTDIQPRLVGTAGGSALSIIGQGFSSQAMLSIDGAAVPSFWIDPMHLGALAPAHAAGVVAVTVADPGALATGSGTPTATIARGLVYGDPSSTPPAPLLLEALWPLHGPLSGGSCPAACLHFEGAGFTVPDLVISIGGAAVPSTAIHLASDQELSIDLPAGAQPGAVDVSVASASESASSAIPASDPGAFHYDDTLVVTSISPASGPASGAPAVAFTLLGAGFGESAGAPLAVRIGALFAAQIQVDPSGTSLTGLAPAGAAGSADVVVIATDADSSQRTATLAAGFNFTAPLALLQVSPPSGAQAGGERVSLYGSGFASGLAVSFGASPATSVQIVSSSEASCLVPAASPGVVDVVASLNGASSTLAQGFTYYDPTSASGGTSGTILQGTLNVTVIDASMGGGLAGANVSVALGDGSTLSALTNSSGQITFSDPRLLLAATVTASKAIYSSITVVDLAVENLTVYLGYLGPSPPPPPPPPPSDAGPPPPAPLATIVGHVYGFKIPPTLTLAPNQRIVAYVRIPISGIYAAPPFNSQQAPLIVTSDGGGFSFQLGSFDPFALDAELGVETSTGTDLSTFEPFLLGVVRGIQPLPNQTTEADIVLDTHLDQTVNAQLTDPPDPGAGNTLLHYGAVDLDLGSAGLIPLTSVQSTTAPLVFQSLPAAEGQGFIFIDIVTNGIARSNYLRRIFGDVSQGVTLGPFLPFPLLQAPIIGGAAFNGNFSWTIGEGLAPNLIQLNAGASFSDGTTVEWSVVLPGTARSVTVPPEVLATFPSGSTIGWTVNTSYAPGFDYNFWNYNDLGGVGEIASSDDYSQFMVP